MIDFLVVNEEAVLLSHVSSDTVKGSVRYLFIKSKMTAEIFKSLFEECWRESRDPDELDICGNRKN